ncbi:MAG: DJ-1/PfpI family protein [Prevotellaceae bacterium]|nr:DJ-1/PfpI family protein [Prevotellaceae bacterium]
MKKVLYVLLPQFAEHELPYLTQPLRSDAMAMKENPKYENKIVAESMEPVEAISGFRVLPDHTFDNIPDDYAALVLIGGYGWKSEAAERVAPLVADAISKGRIVGAICNAASWMASKGFLNSIRHTGNGIEQLQLWGGEVYTNAVGYVNAQVVSDKNIVTANGSASLDFACEILALLKNDEPKEIEMYKTFYKMGLVEFVKMMSQAQDNIW